MKSKFQSLATRLINRGRRLLAKNPDRWLRECRRLIHIGANEGQESGKYSKLGIEVLWIEALPDVFRSLETNLQIHPKQSALLALLTDVEGEIREFNVAGNSGQSSSLFQFKDHVHLWPEVQFTNKIELRSRRLDNLLQEHGYIPGYFDSAVLDVQGAELLVLRGAGSFLSEMHRVCCEAADFEAYAGACNLSTLTEFMNANGFVVVQKHRFHHVETIGAYYDVVYERGPARTAK